MKALLRTKAGPFLLEDSVKLETVEHYRDEGRLEELIRRTDSVFTEFPALFLTAKAERLVRNGNALSQELLESCTDWQGGLLAGQKIRVYGADQTFLALYEWNEQRRCLCAKTMFL